MTLKIFFPFTLTVLISCAEQSKKANDVYIVPHRQTPSSDIKPNEPPKPPPIQTYYLPANFIIDTAGQVYFYQQQQYGWLCGTGVEWDTPPDFINLKPKDIVRVPVNSIVDFIKSNILSLDQDDRRVAIASVRDTIKSVGLGEILKICEDTANRVKWRFRNATQEEVIVLKYKQLNWKYYSDDINWDSSKTRFPPKFENMIKFIPPKVEKE